MILCKQDCALRRMWASQVPPGWHFPGAGAVDTRLVPSLGLPGVGRSPGGTHGNPLQYFCLENSMDRGEWWATGPWGHEESDRTEVT